MSNNKKTDGHTDTQESEYRGHTFRVSGIFPSTYHQGSVQHTLVSCALGVGMHWGGNV